MSATFSQVVDKLGERFFGEKRETFLMHQLKKFLSTEARRELRKNLHDNAIIVYTDYSKGYFDLINKMGNVSFAELPLVIPDNIKSAAFGDSRPLIQVIPQVYG